MGLALNGPLSSDDYAIRRRGGLRAPQVPDYPAEFQSAYRREHSRCDLTCWCHGTGKTNLRDLIASVGRDVPPASIPHEETREELERAEARRRELHHQAEMFKKTGT